jgi:predicted esterase
MHEVLISGKTSFKIEVPYKLYETGEKKKKPLIVYLHGYKQNISVFETLVKDLLNIEAYHLFIQAPYPIYDESRKKKVEEWGRSWYLYDGEQSQFIKSMELSSEFIQEIIDGLLPNIDVSRICLFGYSMGGYLAGYFMLSRWKHVNDAIIIGARIKTEVFEGRLSEAKHINVLAIHGSKDESVFPDPQRKEIEILKDHGLNAEFKLVDTAHKLTEPFIKLTNNWLKELGYNS